MVAVFPSPSFHLLQRGASGIRERAHAGHKLRYPLVAGAFEDHAELTVEDMGEYGSSFL